ncbi:hypothetical protein BJY00DRAFT_295766 [Aspergillus carlsbadensis]|nr:hypothetical protein BJY00DRAFT_295766 [Aspergillus carlsbadensis]
MKTTLTGTLRMIFFLSLDTWKKVNAMHDNMPTNMHPWSQAPVLLEDVLGRVIPVHVDLIDSWEFFDKILLAKFQDMPGLDMISEGHFMLEDTVTGKEIHTGLQWESTFLPGRRVAMSMVFRQREPAQEIGKCSRCGDFTFGVRVKSEPRRLFCYHCINISPKPKFEGEYIGPDKRSVKLENTGIFKRVRLIQSLLPPSQGGWWTCYRCTGKDLKNGGGCSSCCHTRCSHY